MLRTAVSLHLRAVEDAERAAEARQDRQADVLGQRKVEQHALAQAIVGDERDPGPRARPTGSTGGTGAPSTITRPVVGRAEAPKMARASSLEARAGEAGDAEDLARAGRRSSHSPARPGRVRFSTDSRGAVVARRLAAARRAGARLDFAPDHGGHDLGQRHVADQAVGHDLAVAHDGQVVADLEDLAEIVRDEDEADALGRELADQAQDDADLRAGQATRSARRGAAPSDRGGSP